MPENAPIQVVRSVEALRQQVSDWRQKAETIAFVPTMGNLHEGHLSLVKAANGQASRTIVSIFVNPMQFAPDEDFATYPRTFDADLQCLSSYNVDLVFAPPVGVIYPEGDQQTTFVEVPALSSIVEGEFRPGFFRGVATVVNKLFNLVQPDWAFFGQKDYQQLLVIRQMVADLNMPVEIAAVPTMREPDGLAMSSRNTYLSATEREKSTLLYRSMQVLRDLVQQGMAFGEAERQVAAQLASQGFAVDYLVIREPVQLNSPGFGYNAPEHAGKALIILAAARLGKTRLIDNLPFKLKAVQG